MKLRAFVSIILPSLLFCLALSRFDTIITGSSDSDNYHVFASAMLTGDILIKQPIEDIKFYRAIRTPVYPAMILLATGGLQGDLTNMLILHMLIGVVSIVLVSLTLRAYCPIFVSASITAAGLLASFEHYRTLMTEWTSINIVLMMFALVVASIRNPTVRNLSFVGFLASVGIVLRPALAPLLLVLPVLIIYKRRLAFSEMLLYSATLLPILLWMSFNWHYLDSFSIAQLKGHNTLGIGAIVGHAESQPGDSEELRRFIEEFNLVKDPPFGQEDAFVDRLEEIEKANKHFVKMHFENNIYWIAYPLKDSESGIVIFDRDYMSIYGQRAIAANLGNYFKYIVFNLKLFFSFKAPYLALVLLVVPVYALWKRQSLTLAYATLAMFGIHAVSGLLFSTFQAVTDRYVEVTFFPYVTAVAICLSSLVFSRYPRLAAWFSTKIEA